MKVFGYLDVWCAKPGDCVTARLASEAAGSATVDLVAVGQGDERADADGIRFRAEPAVPAREVELAWQATDAGSCALIEGLDRAGSFPASGALALHCQPWAACSGDSVIVGAGSPGAGTPGAGTPGAPAGEACDTALSIGLDADWRPFVAIGDRRSRCTLQLAPRRWYLLVLEWRAGAADVQLSVATADGQVLEHLRIAGSPNAPAIDARYPLVLAGRIGAAGAVVDHFNGRIERPLVVRGAADPRALARRLHEPAGPPLDGLHACWDFAREADSWTIEDVGPHGLHGRLLNAPKRAVRGVRWSGDQLDWRQCPQEYGAIHFHEDDLDDARWAPSVTLELPHGLASGAYALRVRQAGETLMLPLFVRAADPGRSARVAVVFPTFTYLAYANDRTLLHGNNGEVLAARAIALESRDVALAKHPEWGLSLYDTHRDGSGVSLASRRRPTLTFAPDQRAWQGGVGSGRWNYSADVILVDWLQREGIAWEALTDEDIDREGERLLAAYDLVLTGSHPEYATPALVAAYRGYTANGGRLMYLGGNGFYWKVAVDPARPGQIELRRAEDGNRSWAEEPGEYYHQFDGAYGGLWRRSGVAPQQWLGVGYSGQGFRRSVGYRRAADADRTEVAFVFDGVTGREFGLSGAIGGGCAGIEVDRADELLGSPREGYLLASSLPFDETYFMANEELLVTRPTVSGRYASSVRADLFLLATEGGGAVFATGSIAWIGGLARHTGDAGVARITRNVLERFLDPAPLPVRGGPYRQ